MTFATSVYQKRYCFLLALLLLLSACSNFTGIGNSNQLVIYTPHGLTSLASYRLAEIQKNTTIISYQDLDSEVIPLIENETKALFIIPTHTAANLFAHNERTSLIAILTNGMIYLISSRPDLESLDELQDQTLAIPGNGSECDAVAKALFGQKSISYISEYTSNDQIISMLDAGSLTHAILSEPYASSALYAAHNTSLVRSFDLQNEWNALHKNKLSSPLPHLCIAADISYIDEKPKAIKAFISELKAASLWINAHPEEAASLAIEKAGVRLDRRTITAALSSMNLTMYRGSEAKDEIMLYLTQINTYAPLSIGGAMPDEEFFSY